MKKIKIFNSQEEVNAYYVDGVIPSGDLVITRTERSIATTTNNLDGITEYISGEGGEIIGNIPTKLSQLENDTNFVTSEDIEQIIPEIPTKISELENDVNYITEHQSLEDYATKEYVQSEIAQASIGDIDLSEYAKKEDIPTDYLTYVDIQDKVDRSELDNYVIRTELPDFGNIPSNTSDLNNDSGFITLDDVNSIIEDKADKSELDDKVDKSNAITMTATLEDDSTVTFTIYGEQQ